MPVVCLIAEADPYLASLLLRFAEESGLDGVRARTGEELLALAPQVRPDVLILEPELPGERRGWEAVAALRAAEAFDALPIICCSWLKQAEARELMGDCAWHLQKPDLQYTDFLIALEAAGVTAGDGPGSNESAPVVIRR